MSMFNELWNVKLVGILVNDGYETDLVVSKLVLSSINLELMYIGLKSHQQE